ncbi:glycoside hydrolase family 28 protein [Bacillus altitudinis]|uniref:glycoside hydrolase family 28 protein n=1 Tax=Bacillus TaxID=1386 RepID=UPI000260BFC8|nr:MULTISPECIES: glycoside hydrolase family 28 protein [Bacillus]MBR3380392.1 glycoside hydrolase family 28 protein [Bacillus sp. (in: firmicutes)]EIL83815.1 glycoside hydrolase [Bacillus sp. M 2-6]MBR0626802.1 glycoside hydrolase family 28 protein [Bacillus altitudinis S70-5-12]MBV5113185.1 glycoside hydrolase family 28 protein [Bacillus altitudinis]MBW2727282.1 glycoside hydrolase family 28 protein [Bacillus altitudinis]
MSKKRNLMYVTAGTVLTGIGLARLAKQGKKDKETDGIDHVLKQIKAPKFPDREFNVIHYGADNKGIELSTNAIQSAIDDAHRLKGGRVLIPEGTFLTGALELKSNVELHLHENAYVSFSQDTRDYLPLVLTRYEGIELYNYSPLIYAHHAENIAITGAGTLDGRGDEHHWWPWKYGTNGQPSQDRDRQLLFEMAEKRIPVEERVFGEGHYLRSSFIQPYNCQNILIEGVTVKDSPMWQVHPVLSENVIVRGVNIIGHGPNTDGVNPESCRHVLIEDCYFDNGDDCIAIKSGRNEDGRRIGVPSENIVIRRNTMRDGHGGVTIGSEISGGVKYVYAEDNVMDSPNLDRALRIKTNSVRGGTIEHIYFKNNLVKSLKHEVVCIDMMYEEGDAGPHRPVVRHIEVEGLKSSGGRYGVKIAAYSHSPVTHFKMKDCVIDDVTYPLSLEHAVSPSFQKVVINGEHINQ